jgi:oligopeptide/dipeptide ABC transporter ATP-binding protein
LPTIPGRVPELHEMPVGCAFAERCPRADDACRAAPPEQTALAPGRCVRCIHPLFDAVSA